MRLALGADEGSVVRLVLRETGLLLGAGIALGVVGVVALQGMIGRIAFEARASDPSTLLTSVVLLAATGLLACWLPAVRATRVAPVEALKVEG